MELQELIQELEHFRIHLPLKCREKATEIVDEVILTVNTLQEQKADLLEVLEKIQKTRDAFQNDNVDFDPQELNSIVDRAVVKVKGHN